LGAAITLSDHRAVSNARCGCPKGEEISHMQTKADKRVENRNRKQEWNIQYVTNNTSLIVKYDCEINHYNEYSTQ